jgi:hypothetical protein
MAVERKPSGLVGPDRACSQRRRKNLHGIAAWTWALPSWHHFFFLLSGLDIIFSEEAFYFFDECCSLFLKNIFLIKA